MTDTPLNVTVPVTSPVAAPVAESAAANPTIGAPAAAPVAAPGGTVNQPVDAILKSTDVSTPPAQPAAVTTEIDKSPASVIGGAEVPKPVEVKPGDPAPEVKPVETAPVEAPITYTDFKLPEGVTKDQLPEMAKFVEVLTKHKATQDFGQALIDMYVSEVQSAIETQTKVWNDTQSAWRAQAQADPEIGGNRTETVLHTVAGLITEFGGTAQEQKDLRKVFDYTGAGNHPAIVRFLYRMGKAYGEKGPVPAPTPRNAPESKSRATRRYGNGASPPA